MTRTATGPGPFPRRRLGIDVGGTNTDAAVLDGTSVVATVKTTTTDDVLSGVRAALAAVPTEGVDTVVIGTTQFTNAVVQRRGLNRVGFLRLGLPAGASLPPLSDWPADLAAAVAGDTALVAGGYDVDGRPFEPLDEAAVIVAARRFGDLGLDAVVITGAFSPVNPAQEERAAELVAGVLPGASITCSGRLGRLGLLERENAAGLNACLVDLARRTIAAFAAALDDAGLPAGTRLFLTQNDGTLLSLEDAARYPVLTFASGPTNSMRGAALLAGCTDGLVVDVGGTTADFGALVAGYPRLANAAVEVGGVRTLFRLPDLLSIGVGGGSVVRTGPLRVGPDSVGAALLQRARSFGGDVDTLTDAALAAGRVAIGAAIAAARPAGATAADVLETAAALLAEAADRLKLAAGDAPLVAVGGGAFLVPDRLDGIAEVIRPRHGEVANAVGAALAEVSGEHDGVFTGLGREGAIAAATEAAIARAVRAGADPAAVEVLDVEDLPLAYVAGDARRVRVRAVGPLA